MTRRPGAYGIVRRAGRVLLVWDQQDEAWYFPGGGIEAGETAAEALAREVNEETGYRLKWCEPLVTADQPTAAGVTKACEFFLADVDDTDPGPAEHDHEWVSVGEAAARMEEASRLALLVATPSVVTATVDRLPDPVMPDPQVPVDHRQAVVDAGVFHYIEVAAPPVPSPAPARLRVVAANLERGRRLDEWARLLDAADADVVLCSEVDDGMARSGNGAVARDLAAALGMGYVAAVEFVELSLGGDEERAVLAPDAVNARGLHGGAVLSRYPLDRPAAVRFEFDGGWHGPASPEPRVGGRLAVLATVGDLVVVAPHLESHGSPSGRARQLADLLDLVEPYAAGRPVVVGGDLNTHTLDLSGGGEGHGPLTPERFRHPVDHEPLFAEAAARGYGWDDADAGEPTHRTPGGRGDLRLDWFLTRGLTATDPEVIPALAADGTPLSDHEVIAVTVG